MHYWKFAEIPRVEELSFNKVLERFYDYGVSGLIRENIQNSLDGKLLGSDLPVVIKIETGRIEKSKIPGINEITEHIKSLKGKNQYSKETIQHMITALDQKDSVSYFSFEDSNTRGLSGANFGYSLNPLHTYSAYAYSKGIHHEEENDEIEKARGGSHGIGKIASNAASDIYLMFFANCDGDFNQHLGGNIQLIEHDLHGKSYRSTGYFTDMNNNNFFPYPNNFDEIFSKKTRGLKIIIPFFRSQFNYPKDIVTSVCDSFFIAIINNKLVVDYNGLIISHETIGDIVNNSEYYEQKIEETKKNFTPLYYKTYFEGDRFEIVVMDRHKQHYSFDLYFTYNTLITKGRMAVVRTVGMKIEDMKIPGCVNKPFNALLIPKSIKEDSFLKSLENESHTELSTDHFKNLENQRNAKSVIKKLNEEIRKIIEDYIRRNNPTDGIIDTNDIIYDIENKFRDQLRDNSSVIKLGKKELVKFEVGNKKKKNKSEKKIRPSKTKRKVDSDGNVTQLIQVNSRHVNRAIINNKEILNIDLTDLTEINENSSYDMHFVVVDGNGDERESEFNMSSDYKNVYDVINSKNVVFSSGILKEIKLTNKKIGLKMEVAKSYNKALKFMYYLEG